MFRAATLSIVLTLAIGPNASLLCRAVCDQPQSQATGCDHKGPAASASVTGDHGCYEAVPSVSEFLPKDARRDVSFAQAHHATPQLASELAQPAVAARPGDRPEREWPIDKQRLTTTLRL
jgi:hypothetical protein